MQNVTGSVALSEQAGVLLNSGSVTGLLVGGQPINGVNPLPVAFSGSFSSTNPSVGATGSLAPASASLAGFVDPTGLLQPAAVDANHHLIVTGSVGVQGPVFLGSGSLTGLLVGGQPISSVNPLPVEIDSVPINLFVTASIAMLPITTVIQYSGSTNPWIVSGSNWTPTITGLVVVANQVNVTGSNWTPTVTGSVVVSNRVDVSGSNWIPTITGSVVVANQVNITGSVGITSPVAVLQGTTPWIVSGSNWIPQVTGSVRVENTVNIKQVAVSASVVFVSASSNTNTTVAAANPNRLGIILYNDTNKLLYVKLGVSASLNDYTTQMAKDDNYEIPFGYQGRIDAFSPAATTGVVRITEIV